MPIRFTACRPVAIAALLLVAVPGQAYTTLNIWNGPSSSVDGTNYLEASSLALQLSFASVNQFPDVDLNVLEDVDLSTSAFGTSVGNLRWDAPSVNFLGSILWGSGQLTVWSENFTLANSLNAMGVIWDGGGAGVLDVGADSSLLLTGGPLGALMQVGNNSTLELIGHGFQIDTGSGFSNAGFGAIGVDAGTLRGTLLSGESFEIDFSHSAAASNIILTAIPIPAAVWLFGSALGAMGWMRRKST